MCSQDSEDWWDGEFNGQRGYLPAAYVELISFAIPVYDAATGTGNGFAAGDRDDSWSERSGGSGRQSVAALAAAALGGGPLMQNAHHSSSVTMYLGGAAGAGGGSSALGSSGGGSSASAAPLLSHSDSSSDFLGGLEYWTSVEQPLSSEDVLLADGAAVAGASSSSSSFFGLNSRGRLIFSLWSSALAKMSALSALVTGGLTLMMGLYDHPFFQDVYLYIGAYSIILGGLTLVYELFFGRPRRAPTRIPWRALGYGTVMVPLFVAYPTRIPGCLYTIVAAINLVSACRGESLSLQARREQTQAASAAAAAAADSSAASSSAGSSGGCSSGSAARGGALSRTGWSMLPASFSSLFLDASVPHRGRRLALLTFYALFVNTALVAVAYIVLVKDKRASFETDGNGIPWSAARRM